MSQSAIDSATQEKLDALIRQEEGDSNSYKGLFAIFLTLAAVAMSLFHLYAAYAIVPTQVLRTVHVSFVLFLVFLSFPLTAKFKNRLMWWDIIFSLAAIYIAYYAISGGDNFGDRNTAPNSTDVFIGVGLILLILEGVRRTNGMILVTVTVLFLMYALFGDLLPAPWTHKGYSVDRLVGFMYMTLEGIYGTAVDVSATLIILFTIFGAFLQFTGAGKFFIDFSFAAMGGKSSGVGRTIVLSSFLLGGPSGSGVATTVTVGSVAAPMLDKVGYEKNAAGGLLAAGGLGAIISPPVLGAAAFLIADFLRISYLDVLLMSCIPTILFYLGLFTMVEIDVRKYGMKAIHFETVESAWSLSKKYWFHFFSLISIVVFMMMGFSPIMSVFWATVVSALTSMLRRDTAILSYDWLTGKQPFLKGLYESNLTKALSSGSTGVLAIAAAVIAAPALINLGVPAFAAHMFIFYYAVLSEVSPPTALSPFAAAAICKGNPYKTTLQSWKYVAPAILVPFMFTLDKSGVSLLLMGSTTALAQANWIEIAWSTFTAIVGIVCLAGGLQGWFIEKTNIVERLLMIVSGVALAYTSPTSDMIGFAGFAIVLVIQFFKHFKTRPKQAS